MTAEETLTIADETAEQTALPEGWRLVRLGDVCEDYTGTRDPRRNADELFRYVDISSVDNQRKRIIESKSILAKEAPSRARQIIRSNDVIIATTRPNLNAVAKVPESLDNEVCSTGFCVLRATEKLDNGYLFAFVQSEDFIEPLSNLVKGALYPAVTDKQVKSQSIPLPPTIEEQRRIAAVLDRQMKAVEAARRSVEEQLAAAKLLPNAFLRSVFESEDAQNWQKRKLGEMLNLRKDVIHPRNNPKGKALFVGLEHIESATGRRIGAIEVEKEKLTGRKPQFYKDDLVYGYLRPYLNKLWIAEFDGLCSVDQYVYSVNTNKADLNYLAYFMRSPVYLSTAPIDATPGQLPRIRTEEVASVEVKLPSLERQKELAEKLNKQMREVETLKKTLTEQLAAIKQMPSALLRKAFAGEI